MDWTTVIKSLHDEAVRDASRSQDALTMQRDQMSAMVFSISSVVCNRLARALEAGLLMASPMIEGEPVVKVKAKKGGRTSKNPAFIADKDFKPKRGRSKKDVA